jgi:diguanylate cyclase (GGDEF)-like protein
MPEPFDPAFVAHCPDLALVLDAEQRIVCASNGLRSLVPLCTPGGPFEATLDQASLQRLSVVLALGRQAGVALPVDLVHRGRDRPVSAAWRLFWPPEAERTFGLGRELDAAADPRSEIEVLRRHHRDVLVQVATLTGRLHELATLDSLTGLLNRRAFLDRGEAEVVRCRRHGGPLACAMIDVDHFKRINDELGHAAGDAQLRQVGGLLRATLRAHDLPARLGGDEFVALMPETGLDGAVLLADRLRALVAERPVTLPERAEPLAVTVSVGVAAAEGCNSLEELLARADAALLRAKRQGRDQVVRSE